MIILSVPIKTDFPFHILPQYKYDLIEYRWDYELTFPLTNTLPIDDKTIITIRESEEGGYSTLPPSQKILLYKQLINKYNCLVDCEFSFYQKHKLSLPPKNLILSRHMQPQTSFNIEEEISELIKLADSIEARFYKFVLPINNYSDFEYLTRLVARSSKSFIILGTGLLGKLSRLLQPIIGSAANYVAIEDYKTAPEQLTYNDLSNFSLSKINEHTTIGGIIGSANVYNSLGIDYYNNLFKEQALNAVYLPFPVSNLDDFLNWLENFNRKYNYYGFSVTHPYKETLAKRFGYYKGPINLISAVIDEKNNQLPYRKPDYLLNTDSIAMNTALKHLSVEASHRILIFGYGGVAVTALLSTVDYPNVFVSGRDEVKGRWIAIRFERDFINITQLHRESFDLIINCTPIGINNEDFTALTGLDHFNKVIDLPYSKGNTLLIDFAVSRDISFVDGKRFWYRQAQRQQEVFLENINALNKKAIDR